MKKDDKPTYAKAIAELEQIVSRLQNNECERDELKAYTTRSLELLRYCKSRLYETDEELKKMLEELEE